jgi:multisubunit Na+/H+ antiporter MnhC subunit
MLAILISLMSLGINLWIIKQQRAGITINPQKKQNLERLSYAFILAAVLVLTLA